MFYCSTSVSLHCAVPETPVPYNGSRCENLAHGFWHHKRYSTHMPMLYNHFPLRNIWHVLHRKGKVVNLSYSNWWSRKESNLYPNTFAFVSLFPLDDLTVVGH